MNKFKIEIETTDEKEVIEICKIIKKYHPDYNIPIEADR